MARHVARVGAPDDGQQHDAVRLAGRDSCDSDAGDRGAQRSADRSQSLRMRVHRSQRARNRRQSRCRMLDCRSARCARSGQASIEVQRCGRDQAGRTHVRRRALEWPRAIHGAGPRVVGDRHCVDQGGARTVRPESVARRRAALCRVDGRHAGAAVVSRRARCSGAAARVSAANRSSGDERLDGLSSRLFVDRGGARAHQRHLQGVFARRCGVRRAHELA